MGRLVYSRVKLGWGKYILGLGLACALCLATFLYWSGSRVSYPSARELELYLSNNDLYAGFEVINDYQQVYFSFNRQQVFVTEGAVNHTSPVASGRYIAWIETVNGDNRRLVYLYDVIERIKTQLTFNGSAMRLSIQDNRVVWEDQHSNPVVVYYYDGQVVQQISESYNALRPSLRDNQIIYAQETTPGSWQTILYEIEPKEHTVLIEGNQQQAGFPRFIDGRIVGDSP